MALPIDFTVHERNILAESAEIAGLKITRFLPESSAEALLPAIADNHESLVAFIDLGGGTLDISLAELGDGVSEILFTSGDRHFGSVDFDLRLEQLLVNQLENHYGIASDGLTPLAEQVKREFGTSESVTVSYPHLSAEGNIDYLPLCITTSEFETAASDLFLKFDKFLSDLSSHLRTWISEHYPELPSDQHTDGKTAPDYIFLTGQGTKLHLLRKRISIHFPESQIIDSYQENAVIRGLSVQSQILNGYHNNLLLLDTYPSSLHCTFGKESLILLEADHVIPTYHRCFLELAPDESTLHAPLSVHVFETTVTGRKHTLFSTRFTPIPDHCYELRVDINANTKGAIRLLDWNDPDNEYMDNHYCTILYEYRL